MKNKNFINTKRYHYSCGELIFGSFDGKLCLCDWVDGSKRSIIDFRLQRMLKALYIDETSDVIESARRQLNEYFQCKRREFEIPLLLVGSDYQKRVWEELMKIPYGTTVSYSELASRVGGVKFVRSVSNVTAINALSIIIPCHRVIGKNGSLIGYGGGIERKEFLIDLERGI